MSSLLQFRGLTDARKGVRLMFVHRRQHPDLKDWKVNQFQIGDTEDTDGFFTPDRQWYARVWTAWRVPVGMLGCWVQFRYNGAIHAPDLSVPITVDKLPRDAVPMPIDECLKYWMS